MLLLHEFVLWLSASFRRARPMILDEFVMRFASGFFRPQTQVAILLFLLTVFACDIVAHGQTLFTGAISGVADLPGTIVAARGDGNRNYLSYLRCSAPDSRSRVTFDIKATVSGVVTIVSFLPVDGGNDSISFTPPLWGDANTAITATLHDAGGQSVHCSWGGWFGT